MLPEKYEEKYKSSDLKEKIADDSMWMFIPGVRGTPDSPDGEKRIKENDLLFSFIDQYFPEGGYAFEPNMTDGRFIMLPENSGHQGIGVSVSENIPGFLEISQFWYPCEYTEKKIAFGPQPVNVTALSMRPDKELADMIRNVYPDSENTGLYCTFPYLPDLVITLEGYFLDDLSGSVQTIRNGLADADPRIQHSGEGLILFMQRIMGK